MITCNKSIFSPVLSFKVYRIGAVNCSNVTDLFSRHTW